MNLYNICVHVNIFVSKQTPASGNLPLYLLKGDGILEHSFTPSLQLHIVGIQRNTATQTHMTT